MTEPGSDTPTVSVIVATYNRPDVLAAAIRSVLAQDFADWELIVVGDHCGDATGRVVLGFADPRIRYLNLDANHGDQSGPNNAGMAHARGRHIAFLNHDDLWFPDHLGGALEHLETTGADVVIARSALVLPPNAVPGEGSDWRVVLQGLGRRGRYDPVQSFGCASALLLKREAAARAGPWRSARECYMANSHEWLYRVWRCGAVIRTWPQVSVLVLSSSYRPGSYRSGSPEHADFERRLKAPDDLRRLLLDPGRALRPRWRSRIAPLLNPFLRGLARFGVPPTELLGRVRYRYARGEFIDQLRRLRGLDGDTGPAPASPRPGPSRRRELEAEPPRPGTPA
jgi:glycosyltransferase involved in cell wall biosynthesis